MPVVPSSEFLAEPVVVAKGEVDIVFEDDPVCEDKVGIVSITVDGRTGMRGEGNAGVQFAKPKNEARSASPDFAPSDGLVPWGIL